MPKKLKINIEERVVVAKACVEGRIGISEAARRLNLGKSTVQDWVALYREGGPSVFARKDDYTFYDSAFKKKVVEDYLLGKESQREISAKHGLCSTRQLRDWIKVYNSGRYGQS